MRTDLSALISDPACLPHFYDPNADTLAFAHVPRPTRDRIVFLDPRFMEGVPITAPTPLSQLPLAELQRAQPVHFIFHTALCCSTLLARALERPGIASSLREPAVLASFGDVWARATPSETHRRALGVVLDLLSRPLRARERQIVKVSNFANLLAPEVVNLRPASRLILLHSDLEDFLISIASKGTSVRGFGRAVFQKFHLRVPLFHSPELPEESDLFLAAQGWLKQMALFSDVARRFGPGRVRTLNSASFLKRKAETLASVAEHFGLPADVDAWRGVAAGPLFARHAKSPARAFDHAARRAHHDRVRAAHADEIGSVLQRTQALAAEHGLPLSLGDTLFAASR